MSTKQLPPESGLQSLDFGGEQGSEGTSSLHEVYHKLSSVEDQAKSWKNFKTTVIELLKEKGAGDNVINKVERSRCEDIMTLLLPYMNPLDCNSPIQLIYKNDARALEKIWDKFSEVIEKELEKSLSSTEMICVPVTCMYDNPEYIQVHIQTRLTRDQITQWQFIDIQRYLTADVGLKGVRLVGVTHSDTATLVYTACKYQDSTVVSSWESKQHKIREKIPVVAITVKGSFLCKGTREPLQVAMSSERDGTVQGPLKTSTTHPMTEDNRPRHEPGEHSDMSSVMEQLDAKIKEAVETAMVETLSVQTKLEQLQHENTSLKMKITVLKLEKEQLEKENKKMPADLNKDIERKKLESRVTTLEDQVSRKHDWTMETMDMKATAGMEDIHHKCLESTIEDLMEKVEKMQNQISERKVMHEAEVQTEEEMKVHTDTEMLEPPKVQCTDAHHDGLVVLPRGRSKTLDCVMQNVSMPLEEEERDVCKLKRELQCSTSSFCSNTESIVHRLSLAADHESRASEEHISWILSEIEKMIQTKDNRELQSTLVRLKWGISHYLNRKVSTEEHSLSEEERHEKKPARRSSASYLQCPPLRVSRTRRKTL